MQPPQHAAESNAGAKEKPGRRKAILRRIRLFLGAAGSLLIAGAGVLWEMPVHSENLVRTPAPARTYAEALQRIPAFDAAEKPAIGRLGGTQLLTHGAKTDCVVVLFHGYTDAPQQFHDLGQQLYARGWNVLIPRMPHHGLHDRLTPKQSLLTAEEMASEADEAVNIAQGLGKRVSLLGLSAGGVLTAWEAQQRPEIVRAVVVAPAFGYQAVPTALTRPAMNLYRILPNSYSWWDDVKKADASPEYAYPRYSTRALAQLLRLSFAVQAAASERPPAAGSLVVVTNANDKDVNNALTDQVTAAWRKTAGERVQTYLFPASLGLDHDLIEPLSPHQKTALVYPKLIELLLAK